MERFRGIYEFNVIDEIKNGKLVYLIDKKTRTITCVNNIGVSDCLNEIENVKNDNIGRYEVYVWERVEQSDD